MSVKRFSSVKKLLYVYLLQIVGMTIDQTHWLRSVPTTKLSCTCHLNLFFFVFLFVVSFLVLFSHMFNLNSKITTKPSMLIYILSHLFLHSKKGSGAVFLLVQIINIDRLHLKRNSYWPNSMYIKLYIWRGFDQAYQTC